jgi:hypothetical protein
MVCAELRMNSDMRCLPTEARLIRHVLLPAIALLVLMPAVSSPALARIRCDAIKPGLSFKVTLGKGDYDINTQESLDLMILKQAGITARTARRTFDGCIEAWIPNGDGHFRTEYFDPDDLRRKVTGEKDMLSTDDPDATGPGVMVHLNLN